MPGFGNIGNVVRNEVMGGPVGREAAARVVASAQGAARRAPAPSPVPNAARPTSFDRAAVAHHPGAEQRVVRPATPSQPRTPVAGRVVHDQQLRSALTHLDRSLPVVRTTTQRATEVPYGIPRGFEVHRIAPGGRLDVSRLDPKRNYVWAISPDGGLHIAPEQQRAFGITAARPEGRRVTHGDLLPSPDRRSRGFARIGGELQAMRDASGNVMRDRTGRTIWRMDNDSSFTFQRMPSDPKVQQLLERIQAPQVRSQFGEALDPASVRAVRAYLRDVGTDTSNIVFGDFHGSRGGTLNGWGAHNDPTGVHRLRH